MRTPVLASLLIGALVAGGPAAAAPVSVTRDDQREVMVTIYNGNLGLVKDLREVRFPSGQSEVQFMDVAALIDPTTVHLKSTTDAPGSQQFVGEDWIDHTPKDERVKIKLGNAFDVVGERTQKDFRKLASNLYEVEWEIALRNHKTEAQTVTVIEPVPGDWQVLSSSHAYEKLQAHTLKYQIPVPKEGATKLAYRVRIRF